MDTTWVLDRGDEKHSRKHCILLSIYKLRSIVEQYFTHSVAMQYFVTHSSLIPDTDHTDHYEKVWA